jgi:hypothetical protein
MSEACSGAAGRGARPAGRLAAALGLAATPTFAVMALAAGAAGPADMMCSAAPASPLAGMVPMYLLMSAFHAGPWLRLMAGLRGP